MQQTKHIITWWKYCKCKESTEREKNLDVAALAWKRHLKLDAGTHTQKEVTILYLYPLSYLVYHSFPSHSLNKHYIPIRNINKLKLCHKMLSNPSHQIENTTRVLVVCPSHCDANVTHQIICINCMLCMGPIKAIRHMTVCKLCILYHFWVIFLSVSYYYFFVFVCV